MREISLAELALGRKEGREVESSGALHHCPRCGAPTAVLVRFHWQLQCPECAPTTRRCARCGHTRPLGKFDVTPSTRKGPRIESDCTTCRRARGREQFARAQESDRPIVAHRVCRACGKDKPREAFDVDKRYAGGLETICQRCKNEQGYARGRPR